MEWNRVRSNFHAIERETHQHTHWLSCSNLSRLAERLARDRRVVGAWALDLAGRSGLTPGASSN